MVVEIIKAIIFGIVEGITEWLPISSTGHLILVEQFLKFKEVSPEFWNMFQVVRKYGRLQKTNKKQLRKMDYYLTLIKI